MKKVILFAGLCLLAASPICRAEDETPIEKTLNLRKEGVVQADGSFKTKWQDSEFSGKLLCSDAEIQQKVETIQTLLKEPTFDEKKAREMARGLYECVVISEMSGTDDEMTYHLSGSVRYPRFKSGSVLSIDAQNGAKGRVTFDTVGEDVQKVEGVTTLNGQKIFDLTAEYDLNRMDSVLESGTLLAFADDMPRTPLYRKLKNTMMRDAFRAWKGFHLLQMNMKYPDDSPLLTVRGNTDDVYQVRVYLPGQKEIFLMGWNHYVLTARLNLPETGKTLGELRVEFPSDMDQRIEKVIAGSVEPPIMGVLYLLEKIHINGTIYDVTGDHYADFDVRFKDQISFNPRNDQGMVAGIYESIHLNIVKQTESCPLKTVDFSQSNPSAFTVCRANGCTQESLSGRYSLNEDLGSCLNNYTRTIIPTAMREVDGVMSQLSKSEALLKLAPNLSPKPRAPQRVKPPVKPVVAPPKPKATLTIKENATTDEIVKQIVNDPTNYSLGNPNGKFVIIEFFDYNCGWCKETNKVLHEALARPDTGNIRWIPIDTPIFGENSERISRYILAAGKQGKYAEMHRAVSEAKGRLDEADLTDLANSIGLDTIRLKKDAESEEIYQKMADNQVFKEALHINGVPMLIVNGTVKPGALIGDALEEAIAESAKMGGVKNPQPLPASTKEVQTFDDGALAGYRNAVIQYALNEISEDVQIIGTKAKTEKKMIFASDVTPQATLSRRGVEQMYAGEDGTVVVKMKPEIDIEMKGGPKVPVTAEFLDKLKARFENCVCNTKTRTCVINL